MPPARRRVSRSKSAKPKPKRKYARQAPNESATAFAVGTLRTGNDGAEWVVRQDKNGRKSWRRDRGDFGPVSITDAIHWLDD